MVNDKISIRIYSSDQIHQWNDLVSNSRNATFLHQRHYIEYHQNRFTDHSLLFHHGNDLLAVLPGHTSDTSWVSHQGLTYDVVKYL